MNSNLNEITTPQQLKNGTRMFQCIHTGDLYGSYASGYVRRKAINSGSFYQLNKKVFYSPEKKAVIRIMIKSEADRLDLINRRTLNTKPQQQKEEVMLNTNNNTVEETTASPIITNTKSRSFIGSNRRLKWPSYIVQVVHSSMMLNETPEMIADRLDQMLTDIPNHRFIFNSQQEKIEAISNVMNHLHLRANQSTSRIVDHIDNVCRRRG